MSAKKTFSPELLRNLYKETKSLAKMSTILGCSEPTVHKYMNQFGIEYVHARKYTVDKNFFCQTNEGEVQFYWAGFLAANGNITYYVGSENSKRGPEKAYRIFIDLAVYDKEQLEKLNQALGSNAPIKKEIVLIKGYPYPRISLLISSKDLVNDLVMFGIIPNKKLTYCIPEWIMANPNLRHFIRGWVDGLGGFYTKDSKSYFRTTGTIQLLNQLKTIFLREAIANVSDIIIDDSNDASNFTLMLNNEDSIERLYKWLYSDCTVWLERKRPQSF